MRATGGQRHWSQTAQSASGGATSGKGTIKPASQHGREAGMANSFSESVSVPLETEVRRQTLKYMHQHSSTTSKEAVPAAVTTAPSPEHTSFDRKPDVPRLARRVSKTPRPPFAPKPTGSAVTEESTQTTTVPPTDKAVAAPGKEAEKSHAPPQVSEATQTPECVPSATSSSVSAHSTASPEHASSGGTAADARKSLPTPPTEHKQHQHRTETVKPVTTNFSHTTATFPGARRVDDEVIPLRTKIYVGAGIVFGVLIAGYLVRCCMRLDMISAAGVAVHDGVRRVLAPTNGMFSSAGGVSAPWRTRFRTHAAPSTRAKPAETTTTVAANTIRPEQVVGRIRDRLIEHKLQKIAT